MKDKLTEEIIRKLKKAKQKKVDNGELIKK